LDIAPLHVKRCHHHTLASASGESSDESRAGLNSGGHVDAVAGARRAIRSDDTGQEDVNAASGSWPNRSVYPVPASQCVCSSRQSAAVAASTDCMVVGEFVRKYRQVGNESAFGHALE